jgi:hypothetical protein
MSNLLELAALPEEYAFWIDDLPADYDAVVIAPWRFETHVDEVAHARKVVGLDEQGQRCYVRHTHTVTVERFDIEEYPLEVPVLRERRVAWRLSDGRWLSLSERAERLDSCRPRLVRSGPELLSGALAGF